MKKIMLILLSLFALTYLQAMERGDECGDESKSRELPKLNTPDDLHDSVNVKNLELVEKLRSNEIMTIIILFVPNATEQVDTKSISEHIKAVFKWAPNNKKSDLINLMLVCKQFNLIMQDPQILVAFLKQVVEKSPQKAIKTCITATSNGNTNIINLFIKAGLAIDACDENGLFMLRMAIIQLNSDLVKLLIDLGANVNNCCDNGSSCFSSMFKVFRENQAWCFTKKMTPLMIACANGANSIVIMLLEAGADIDTKDSDGNTALMFAASRGMHETVNILMSRGANAYLTNKNENDAIILAYISHRRQVIEYLLQHDAKLIYSLLNCCYSERAGGAKKFRWHEI